MSFIPEIDCLEITEGRHQMRCVSVEEQEEILYGIEVKEQTVHVKCDFCGKEDSFFRKVHFYPQEVITQ